MDTDGSGEITVRELGAAMRRVDHRVTDAEVFVFFLFFFFLIIEKDFELFDYTKMKR